MAKLSAVSCLLAVSSGWPQEPQLRRNDDTSAASPAPENAIVTVLNGKVTVRPCRCERTWLLEELGRKAGVTIIVAESEGEAGSVQLTGVPVDEAVRRLAAGHDVFFYYSAEGGGGQVLTTAWVYPKGRARKLQPGPPEAWASRKELETRLSDPDPDVRTRAYEAALGRTTNPLDLVNRLIREEKDPDVRTRVLSAVFAGNIQLPAEMRIWLASSDPSEQVRIQSLESLAGDPNLRRVAEAAQNDLDPDVRNRAKEILEELDGAPANSGPR